MSLQIRVSEVVGEWLAVPLTQRNNFRHFSRLLNPRSLVCLLLLYRMEFHPIAYE